MDKIGPNDAKALLSRQVTGGRYFFLNLAPGRTQTLALVMGGREQCNPDYALARRHFPFHGIECVVAGRGSVTLDGETHALGDQFMVVATQNPIENQGVYPLPEAQLDRFAFKLLVEYPTQEEEARIVSLYGQRSGPPSAEDCGVTRVADAATIAAAQASLHHVTLAPEIVDYTVRLVRATRDNADIASGASPRAAVMLANAARARAALQGRAYVIPDDVKALATSVLRHRLLLSPAAEIEGRQIEDLVATLIDQTEAPR